MRRSEQEYDGRTMHFRQLDSIGEMIDAMQHAPEQQEQSDLGAASLRTDEERWSGTRTMDEAIELARYGWEEGRQRLRQAVGRIALDQLVGRRPIVESRLDFAGDEVDIGAYLHGEPEHMVDYQVRQDTHGKQAMMYVNASVASRVSSERIMQRGGALYAAIEALRTEGYSLGLTMVDSTKNNRFSHYTEYQIPVVQPGEYLDIDTAAFCLAHPAFLRRGVFALNEHESNDIRYAMGFMVGGGYGEPTRMASNLPPHSFLIDQGEGLDLRSDDDMQHFAQKVVDRTLETLGHGPVDRER
jgi:probable phage protein